MDAVGQANQGMLVTEIGPHDILLGRGAPFLNYEGTRSFRALVRTKRNAYRTLTTNKEKNAFTKEIIDEMHRRGARFLQCVDDESSKATTGVSVHQRLWKVASDKIIMAKCKQTLRDKDPPPKQSTQAASTKKAASNTAHSGSEDSAGEAKETTRPLVTSNPTNAGAVRNGNPYVFNGSYTPQGGWPPPLPPLIQGNQTASGPPTHSGSYPVNTSLSLQPANYLGQTNQQVRNLQQQIEAQRLLGWGQYFLHHGQQRFQQLEQQMQATLALATVCVQVTGQQQQHQQSEQPSFQPDVTNAFPVAQGFASFAGARTVAPAANDETSSFPQQFHFLPTLRMPEASSQAPSSAANSNAGIADGPAGAAGTSADHNQRGDAAFEIAPLSPSNRETGAGVLKPPSPDNQFADIMGDPSPGSLSEEESDEQSTSSTLDWLQRELNNNINKQSSEILTTAETGDDFEGGSDSSSSVDDRKQSPQLHP